MIFVPPVPGGVMIEQIKRKVNPSVGAPKPIKTIEKWYMEDHNGGQPLFLWAKAVGRRPRRRGPSGKGAFKCSLVTMGRQRR